MNAMQILTQGIHDCPCGKDHTCPIDAIEIGPRALEKLPALCAPYQHILLVADTNTWRVCGETASRQIAPKIDRNVILQNNTDVVVPNEEKIAEIEACLTDATDLIVGVGSGVINDLCKQVSFPRDLPYFIVATAPSMDGYASVGAALILQGMKITLNARPPKAILADTTVLKDAPLEMLQSGYGAIVGKYSCLNDWKLSALINGEYFCQKVYDLVAITAQKVETLAEGILRREESAVGALMEALVTVGVAMSYVGNSRPASGSEHHLSHFFEITGILHQAPYFCHGVDVLYSAVVTAGLREEMLRALPRKKAFDRADWEANIRRIYTTSADGILALQEKLGWYQADDSTVVSEQWETIRAILAEAPDRATMLAMVERIGLDYKAFETLYGEKKIADAIQYAKDLKDRYTVLWLYDRYFGKGEK